MSIKCDMGNQSRFLPVRELPNSDNRPFRSLNRKYTTVGSSTSSTVHNAREQRNKQVHVEVCMRAHRRL